MGKDKKEERKETCKNTATSKRSTRTAKKKEEVEFPTLSLPSTSHEPPSTVDEEELHERMLDCRSMERPAKVTVAREVSSDEESIYTQHTKKRRRVRVGRGLELEGSDYTPRSPSPRVDPSLADSSTLKEFKIWMSEDFLKMRGALDHILAEIGRVGRKLSEVEESHRLEKLRIKSLQEKSLTQTGHPPPNPTTPMSAPPSSSQATKPAKDPWGGGAGVL